MRYTLVMDGPPPGGRGPTRTPAREAPAAAGDRRPRLHFAAARGWLNDPLGVTWHDGRYHLFFQHVPGQPTWQPRCHWGHASSPDLVSWTEHPVALAPTPDEAGAWSGCVVVPADGSAALLYTSSVVGDLDRGRVRLARPEDGAWQRWVPGPVVVDTPDTPVVEAFRDPFVLRDGDRWRMVVGARLPGGTAAALGWTSADLEQWEYDGPLAERHTSETEPVWTGTLWECPQLINVDGHDVLLVSVHADEALHHVAAAVGERTGGRLAVHGWQQLTAGVPYAATAFRDRDGAPVLIHWLRDVADLEAGWAGALGMPLRLGVSQGRLRLSVHATVERRRRAGLAGTAIDVAWTPAASASSAASAVSRLELRAGGGTVATVSVDGESLSVAAGGRTAEMSRDVEVGVRVLVDGPVLEVVAGGYAALPLPAYDGEVAPRCAPEDDLRWWSLD